MGMTPYVCAAPDPFRGYTRHGAQNAVSGYLFIDGNKRASVIFANHYLISHGQGFLVIPEEHVPEFKRKLVDFYEGENIEIISDFIIA